MPTVVWFFAEKISTRHQKTENCLHNESSDGKIYQKLNESFRNQLSQLYEDYVSI